MVDRAHAHAAARATAGRQNTFSDPKLEEYSIACPSPADSCLQFSNSRQELGKDELPLHIHTAAPAELQAAAAASASVSMFSVARPVVAEASPESVLAIFDRPNCSKLSQISGRHWA